jgi:putative addiction module component (TIGR02574 family)
MPKTKDITQIAQSLPVDQRLRLVDSLLSSLNPPDPEIDKKWLAVANRRLAELRSGKVKGIPADEVFAQLRKQLAK